MFRSRSDHLPANRCVASSCWILSFVQSASFPVRCTKDSGIIRIFGHMHCLGWLTLHQFSEGEAPGSII